MSECKEIKALMKIDIIIQDELDGDEDSVERILEYIMDKYCYTYKSGRRQLLSHIEWVLKRHVTDYLLEKESLSNIEKL